MQSSIAISVFLASIFRPLSRHLLFLRVGHLPFFHLTSPCTPQYVFLELSFSPTYTFFSYIFSDQPCSLPRLFLPGCFSQTWTCSSCFSARTIGSSAFMQAGVTHKLRTFPLRLRDMRLSPIASSSVLQSFAPAVILIVTKSINLVQFALGKCNS